MPEGLALAWATPGLVALAVTFLVAGWVSGFAGFGTALIVMPVAGALIPIPVAIVVLSIAGITSWPIKLPRAWRNADRGQVGIMAAAALLALPLGVWLLSVLSREGLRWIVSAAAALTLAALISGWRYRGTVRRPGLAGIGGAAGVLGGATGLTGPPVILFYLAGRSGAEAVRANTILFLAILEIGVIANIVIGGLAGVEALWLGVLLVAPYLIGVIAGQAMFDPAREGTFRALAYTVIGLAILTGLPLFD